MLDHIFLTVADLERSIAFYEGRPWPLSGLRMRSITMARMVRKAIRTLRVSDATTVCFSGCARGARHREQFMLDSSPGVRPEVRAFYKAALAAGASDNGEPEQGFTMTLVTMRPMSSIPTV